MSPARKERRRVLFLAPQVPFPLDTGGKIRTFYQLKALARHFEVDLLTLDEPEEHSDPLWLEVQRSLHSWRSIPRDGLRRRGVLLAAARGLLGPLPYPVEKYRSAQAAMVIEEMSHGGRYDAVHFDSLHTFRFAPHVKPGAKLVLDEHNVEALILERMAQVAPDPLRRALIQGQARRTDDFERRSAQRADRVLLCSQEDLELLAQRSERRDNLTVIPNGVDVGRFVRQPEEGAQPYAMFLGSMDWWPNDDGVRWFVETAWPRLHRAWPELTLKVVGRNPSSALTRLATPGVEILGGVPDVRPFMANCAAFVVPLRVGGGTRLKILEAMAMQAPIVSTAIGCEGLAVEHERELLVADTPEGMVQQVLRLRDEPALVETLRQQGRACVEARYSWEAIGERLCEVYHQMWERP